MGDVKERYGLGRMDPTVLFCGRMVWQKGPDILMEAVPPLLGYYPHAKFVFVGDGDMRWGLEERARQLGVAHATRFLGHRNGVELIELFKSCDAVCVPSRNEPFGIVVLEAWAAGKPVVATRNGGPHEFVRHGIDGYTIYDNPDSVGWGLGTLFMDFERARQMGRNGRVAVEQRFDWEKIGRRTTDIYSE
jgi:glycosyltransferase involved in cell wall biosynthesis